MLFLELTKVIKELCYFKTTKNVILLINTFTINSIQNHLINIYIYIYTFRYHGKRRKKNQRISKK